MQDVAREWACNFLGKRERNTRQHLSDPSKKKVSVNWPCPHQHHANLPSPTRAVEQDVDGDMSSNHHCSNRISL